MDSNVRNFFHNGDYRRMAAIIATAVSSIGYLIPSDALCLVNETDSMQILDSVDSFQTDKLKKTFDDLEKSIAESENCFVDSERFLNEFLKELESRYSITLTIQQACKIVKENLDNFQLPDKVKASLLITIDLVSEKRVQESALQEVSRAHPEMQILFIGPGSVALWNHLSEKKHHKNQHKKKRVFSNFFPILGSRSRG